MEAARPNPGILGQRPADPPGADEDDAIGALEPEDLPEPTRELGHGLPEPALAEVAEEREVLAHFRRRAGPPAGEPAGGNGGMPLLDQPLGESRRSDSPSSRALADIRLV